MIKAIGEILVVLFILLFGISSIIISWGKQNKKYAKKNLKKDKDGLLND